MTLQSDVYITYNPFPLVLLTDPSNGRQAIHIAPNAHEIAPTFLHQEAKFWERLLGKALAEVSVSNLEEINHLIVYR